MNDFTSLDGVQRSLGLRAEEFLEQRATLSKKRPRDIRGIERFRQVVYSPDGFPRLHAMVQRNPVLMYPIVGVAEARRRVREYEQEVDKIEPPAENMQDADLIELAQKRRRAEERTRSMSTSTAPSHQVMEAATYHHRQLDQLLKLVYEFNHVTFLKLPMTDTLQLLSRCGREAVAHLTEFEVQERLKRAPLTEDDERRLEHSHRDISAFPEPWELQDPQDVVDFDEDEMELANEFLRQTIESLQADSPGGGGGAAAVDAGLEPDPRVPVDEGM